MKQLILLLPLLGLLCSCGNDVPTQDFHTKSMASPLNTVWHDDHKFILWTSNTSILHHPDCHCGKASSLRPSE